MQIFVRALFINIYNEDERPAAKKLAKEIEEIHTEKEIKKEITILFNNHRPQSVHIVNLSDQKDKEPEEGKFYLLNGKSTLI